MKKEDIENFKQERWFYITHKKNCTICGKAFGHNENSFIGLLEDGSFAHTCEKCSSNLANAHYCTNNHRVCHEVPAASAKLWRYLDLAKFLSLLEDKSLFFTRLNHFCDPYEGALGTKQNEEVWIQMEMKRRKPFVNLTINENKCSEKELQVGYKEEFENYRKKLRKWRSENFVSCWHQSDCESEAMWQLYTRDTAQGLAIQTTFERIYNSLPITTNADFGLVNYIDYNEYNNGNNCKCFHAFDAPWYKRKSFEHEQEFRVIINNPDLELFTYSGDAKIPVDLNVLIENIYVSPKSEEWFVDLVRSILKRYGCNFYAKKSDLNKTPFW